MRERDGFTINNLKELERKFNETPEEISDAIRNLLETLGETLLNLAKEHIRSEIFPHAVFKQSKNKIVQGRSKGQNRISIKYAGSENRNMIGGGGDKKGLNLWNSLQRGSRGNVWTFSGSSGNLRLKVGSTLEYAKYVHEGYTIKKDHWVPGIVDSTGKFRHVKGAKTGIMARARTFKGVPFLEVSLKELEKLAPDLMRRDLERLFGGLVA